MAVYNLIRPAERNPPEGILEALPDAVRAILGQAGDDHRVRLREAVAACAERAGRSADRSQEQRFARQAAAVAGDRAGPEAADLDDPAFDWLLHALVERGDPAPVADLLVHAATTHARALTLCGVLVELYPAQAAAIGAEAGRRLTGDEPPPALTTGAGPVPEIEAVPPAHLLLTYAQLRQAMGRHDDALQLCAEAEEAGADPLSVASCRSSSYADTDRPDLVLATLDPVDLGGSAVLLLRRAHALSRLGRFEEAVAAYGDALDAGSPSGEACANRGAALARLGRPAEALADFDRAMTAWPGREDLLLAAARLLDPALMAAAAELPNAPRIAAKRVDMHLNGDDLAAAETELALAARLWPGHEALDAGRARLLVAQDRPAEALALLGARSDVPALLARAGARAALDDWPGARADYDAAFALEPGNSDAAIGAVIAAVHFEQYTEAVEVCTRAMAAGATGPEVRRLRGELLYRLDRTAEAIADFTAVAEHAEPDLELFATLYSSNAVLGEFEAALHICDLAAAAGADDIDWSMRRTTMLQLLDRDDENLAWSLEALRRWPDNDGVRAGAAESLLIHDRPEEALAALGDNDIPDDVGWWHLWRGIARARTGDPAGAASDFAEAVSIARALRAPDQMWPANLAHYLLFAGDRRAAEHEYAALLSAEAPPGSRLAALSELRRFRRVLPDRPGLDEAIAYLSSDLSSD